MHKAVSPIIFLFSSPALSASSVGKFVLQKEDQMRVCTYQLFSLYKNISLVAKLARFDICFLDRLADFTH